MHPLERAGAQHFLSPMVAENGAVMKSPYRNAMPIDEQ
jgi:hypothetical protein